MTDTDVRTAVVIEDDADIRFLLEATLGQAGFAVHAAGNGTAGVELVRAHQPLVTTLDISLPDIDGFEVARRIRTFSSTYLVMLTGRAEEIDTLLGLDAGADDYVTKPFRPRELRARIEAMLRRPRTLAAPSTTSPAVAASPDAAGPQAGTTAGSPSSAGREAKRDGTSPVRTPNRVLEHGGLRLDVDARIVELDGAPVHLTRSEFDLLAALLAAPNRVVSKNELVRRLWGEDYSTGAEVAGADRRTVEVHVANLRRKLGEDASSPRFIETVRGVGYRLTPAR
ncbi:response regulator transcription factor [Georgenia sp. EYE_87]|uniref:response regulator transcription factor n=1 Tax=Georgenia sp. EYE_87 TaxID=2853448 RepID=UPI002006D231|nr:response regulator transcription factor [Georgenia sp. EYE_87]MCK6210893.1 response regulator transcription factor [Georgenia sp. EYE_87]